MGARIRVFLTPEEDRTLRELHKAKDVPQRVKDRAQVVRMNARGDYIETIAAYFNWTKETVRRTLKRWEGGGLGGLWEAQGRGRPRRWTEEDMTHLDEIIRNDEKTHTSQQLAGELSKNRKVNLSAGYLRNLLKKRGSAGSVHVRAIDVSKILHKRR
jgi:transposase